MLKYDEVTKRLDINIGDKLVVVNREPIYGGHYFEIGDTWTVTKMDDASAQIVRDGVEFDKNDMFKNAYDFGWFDNIFIYRAFDRAE